MALWKGACAASLVFLVTTVATPAVSREAGVVSGSILKDYTSVTKARKVLRSRLKKGQALSGDEYFALAYACGYDEPDGPSKIMNALAKSKCKDQVGEYYVQAGMHGTPEGFLAAAKAIGTGQAAWLYAQLAYKLSGTDVGLRDEALAYLGELRPTVGASTQQADAQAETLAQQLVASGAYASSVPSAGGKQLANAQPELKWLDFPNPRRCRWSKSAQDVFDKATGYDERRQNPVVPAKLRVPGVNQWVTSRVARPHPEWNQVDIYVDFKGRWNGLTVVGVMYSGLEESEGLDYHAIRFAEPVEKVAKVLAGKGFVVNVNGKDRQQVDKRDADGNIDGVITSVTRRGKETWFGCDEVFYASYGEG
ncbi:MAG: hypothetical protein IE933_03795 [Sphingomonadales bacterium]|nr:hypothetical protein [Sphingomonadales bacterium]MBD3774808.1 hypothetical protein [Paracoccaceae bacterium]